MVHNQVHGFIFILRNDGRVTKSGLLFALEEKSQEVQKAIKNRPVGHHEYRIFHFGSEDNCQRVKLPSPSFSPNILMYTLWNIVIILLFLSCRRPEIDYRACADVSVK